MWFVGDTQRELQRKLEPHIPRNLILKYTNEGYTVVDPFDGSGTTMIECTLLNREGVGLDINNKTLEITKERLNFKYATYKEITLFNCSATKMTYIEDNSIDLACTHHIQI